MNAAYLDSSAALKLMVEEPESLPLVAWTDEHPDLVGTLLVETELRRNAHDLGVPQALVSDVLRRITLHEVTAGTFREAGALAGVNLRSSDALHVASTLRLGCRVVVTYDDRLADCARELGLDVVSPGR